MKQNTKAIHFSYQKPDAYGALTMPVYHTAAYEFADADVQDASKLIARQQVWHALHVKYSQKATSLHCSVR